MSLWDWKAAFYRSARRLYPFRSILAAENRALSELTAAIPHTGRAACLDLGCGYGNAADYLPSTCSLFFVDRSLPMLRQARARHAAPAVVADAAALPFRQGTFSVVVAVGLLEYVEDMRRCFAEVGKAAQGISYFIVTIARRTWGNRFRRLLGTRLFWHRREQLDETLRQYGFHRVASRTTWLQEQYLYRRNHAEHNRHSGSAGSQPEKHQSRPAA